jgi:hypothetical protein
MNSSSSSPSAFRLYISYSQIAVFRAGLETPFSDWTQAHVDQGFAWRPESVSFRCLGETGEAAVSVTVKSHLTLRPDAVRVIQVPFVVPPGGRLEIASITDAAEVQIDEGAYALVFETGTGSNGAMWCDFSFIRTEKASFSILRAGADLRPASKLVLTAEPA